MAAGATTTPTAATRGPVVPFWPRAGARALDLVLAGVAAIVVLALLGDADRPIGDVALAAATLFAYEAISLAATGTTIGKRAAGLRVVGLDTARRPTVGQAARRAACDAAFAGLLVVGWLVWLVGIVGDPVRRGGADRAAATMVVPRELQHVVRTRDLPGYADGARPPRMTALGRAGDADVRARARLLRLEGIPALAALVGALALAMAVVHGTWVRIAVASAVWLVAFVADEARRIHRGGTTPGHGAAGLVVVDARTGEPPATGRAALRAVVLGLTLYVPVLWPLLAISLVMMWSSGTGQGLHDLAGRTLVVADPRVAPEDQRQRAMAVRIGRVR